MKLAKEALYSEQIKREELRKHMATKITKQTPQVFHPKQVSAEEPDKTIVLTDADILKKAFAEGWMQDNHPMQSKRFFRNIKTGDVAQDFEELKKKHSP